LVLEFGKPLDPKYILIDGGPDGVFVEILDKFLKEKELTDSNSFEVMVLTHVDEDHVLGLMDYLKDYESNIQSFRPPRIKEVWHNYLEYEVNSTGTIDYSADSTRTRGLDDNNLQNSFVDFWNDFNEFNNSKYNSSEIRFPSNFTSKSIQQGDDFRRRIEELKIPINTSFHPENEIIVENHPTVDIEDIKIEIIGPSKKILDLLIKKWKKWVKKRVADRIITRGRDARIPNRSSIMFLVSSGSGDDEKRILFTGDGRGDYIISGLKERGLLSENEYFFVDILKLPHHGSEYNVTPEFFDVVRATHYVASGNGGQHANPNSKTLKMIADAAKAQERNVTIWVTYDDTDQINIFRDICPEEDYTYKIKTVDSGKTFFTLELLGN